MKKTLFLLLSLISLLAGAQTPVVWNRTVPLNYDGAKQITQWLTISPNIALPTDHFYYNSLAIEGWTIDQAFAKGVTHWARLQTDFEGGEDALRARYPTKGYNNVPRSREVFGLNKVGADNWVNGYNTAWWPNGPWDEATARAKANAADILPRLYVAETQEGEDYMPTNYPMHGWWWDQIATRYEARYAVDGIPYFIAANYFTIGLPNRYSLGNDTRENNRSMYLLDPSAWPVSNFHPGQPLARTNLFCEGIYINAPDTENPIGALWHLEVMKKLGKKVAFFAYPEHEWRPNNLRGIRYTEGTLYRYGKIPLAPGNTIAYAFLAQEFGNGYVEWGGPYQTKNDRTPVSNNTDDKWFPTGATSPQPGFPHYASGGEKVYWGEYGNYSHFGTVLYAQTFGTVASGTPYYARYRLNGGSWFERRTDGTDLVDCYYDRRGFVRCRISGGKMAILYYNPYADNTKKTIEIQDPLDATKTYTATVAGNGIHAVLINR